VRSLKPRKRKSPPGTVRCTGCGLGIVPAHAVNGACPVCKTTLPDEKPARKKPTHFEDAHMAAFADWIEKSTAAHPDLEFMAHWPNGGERGELEAKRMAKQGVKAGPPDWYLDVARGGYFGLRIEMKPTREELGKKPWVRPIQLHWIEALQGRGYFAVSCEGWDAAREATLHYLSLPLTVPTVAPRALQGHEYPSALSTAA